VIVLEHYSETAAAHFTDVWLFSAKLLFFGGLFFRSKTLSVPGYGIWMSASSFNRFAHALQRLSLVLPTTANS
jgi:hypothetical protein